ncbi:orotidine-5'-phosphate decarboxylase [Geothermobacter hydrogeniphilus]|uniref:Orotidine 5'-phosphate decarboxylase n=1 Tax=Geothermobacter hydrogeniphilus TaxID=1969733 RepID=A0A2K2HEB7_9BACT|nr:orotidine-5'-phosphate decarboxylase [Geothermobacter hydrogeniphilus]PNU21636.1 orotidine-5'-phosphate decarboxylase [Geothermobacter hydrogeniphilus]
MIDKARERLIFALDVDSLEEAQRWVALLHDKVGVFKVGKQLFTRCGPQVVRMIRDGGGEVFLDLKYHDIPNTVAMAALEACRLGVKMFNVHALGGAEMMRTTVARVDEQYPRGSTGRPLLLAVTILTSSTDQTLLELGIDRPVAEMVPRLARLAADAGFDGVVASPREVEAIRAACGPDFAIVTPGVRPAFASVDDQKRVTTPADALVAGSDYLVIGRPISAADDPQQAAGKILQEMAAALDAK